METFLESLWSQLEKCDGSMVWALSTSEEQLNLCRLTVERAVVGQIFVHAMYPNGEADISRDDVSFEISFVGSIFFYNIFQFICLDKF